MGHLPQHSSEGGRVGLRQMPRDSNMSQVSLQPNAHTGQGIQSKGPYQVGSSRLALVGGHVLAQAGCNGLQQRCVGVHAALHPVAVLHS